MISKIPYCFTMNDIICKFKSEKQFYYWLEQKMKNNLVKKVRQNLYVTIDSMQSISATKFEIASKISDNSFIAYHSALEYYGLTNQVFNSVIVGNDKRFSEFEFDDIEYTCKVVKNFEQVNKIESEKIKVTTLEKTIIDCIDNINLAGGIEEILNALSQIKILSENKLLDALNSYNKVLLYQKTGYILEQFKQELSLSDKFFKECESKLTNQTKYFLNDEFKDVGYNKKWKLIAPQNLKSIINGGL